MESNHSAGSSILNQNSNHSVLRSLVFQSAIQAPERSLLPLILNVAYFIIKSAICIYFLLKSDAYEEHLNRFVSVSISIDIAYLILLLHRIQNISMPEPREISFMNLFIRIVYFSNQIYGNYYYYSCKECEYTCPTLNSLTFALLVFGYINFVVPILIIFCVILCIHVLITILARAAPRQHPATDDVISSLPVEKFKVVTGDSYTCPICRENFQEGEDYIALPCGNQHLFHDECIKCWLRINSVCPLCKADIK